MKLFRKTRLLRSLTVTSVVLLLVAVLLPLGAFPSSVSNADEVVPITSETTSSPPVSPPDSSSAVRNAYLLLKLQQYLARSQTNYAGLQTKIDETREEIDENRETLPLLGQEVDRLGKMTAQSEAKIRNVETQIQEKEIELKETLKAIRFNTLRRDQQKKALSSSLRLLYFQKNLYYDGSKLNPIKLLFQSGTLSSVLQAGTYFDLLKDQGEDLMADLSALDEKIQRQNFESTLKRQQLADLREQLDGEHRTLAAQLEGKKNLMKETRGSDAIYRELMASYLATQEAILTEINLFNNNVEILDQRIALLSPQLTQDEREEIATIRSEKEGAVNGRMAADFLSLRWPVPPKLGLTAFFDDGGYTAAFGVPHHAVDIRTAHGSLIYAPADGVVYKVYDAAALEDPKKRLDYGYMIIAHRKGVMTLYGHISGALVQEGQFVRRGQIIGLTGGVPGTPGAGGRTTGAHLHFEVLQDGVRVDPLEYLSLREVPVESLPEQYLLMLEAELRQDLRVAGVDVESFEDLADQSLESLDEAELMSQVQATLEELRNPPGTEGSLSSEGDVAENGVAESYDTPEAEPFDEESFWTQGERTELDASEQ